MVWKNRVIANWSFLWYIVICPRSWRTDAKQFRFQIGVVFDIEQAELLNAYTLAMSELSARSRMYGQPDFEMLPRTEFISSQGDWCQISHVLQTHVCKNGVGALVSAILSESHLEEFLVLSHKFGLPVVAPAIPNTVEVVKLLDYSMRPVVLHKAIMDMMAYYNYRKFIYLYTGREGLRHLQSYYDSLNLEKGGVRMVFAKRFNNKVDFMEILRDIEKSSRWALKLVVLDCPIDLAREVLLSHVRDQSIGRRTFHYIVAGLAFDDNWSHQALHEISPLNITGFRILDRSRPFVQEYSKKWSVHNFPTSAQPEFALSPNAAFVHDTLLVLKECATRLSKKDTMVGSGTLHPLCSKNASDESIPQRKVDSQSAAKDLQQEIRNIQIEGLSGNIQFSKSGERTNFTLHVMEVKANGSLMKVGEWKEGTGYISDGNQPVVLRTYVMTTVLESPYMMLKPRELGEPEIQGNDKYEGFFKDVADAVTAYLNITYTIQIADSYGSRNSSIAGGWTGMMGELVRNEADIGIGALTANAAREQAVLLSKSVIFLGISIMLFKPERNWQQDVFAFMRPLSRETWMCIGLAYLSVSAVLFVIAKFNKKELQSIEKEGVVKMKPQFSMSNSLWFTFASLVGQGTDLCPRSISARLVGSVWWFLILIVTSSYTANFAAIQTISIMEVPINSAADLAAQQSVKYGHLEGGATAEFFKKTKVADYRKMAEFIESHRGVNAKSVEEGIARVREEKGKYAFLLESTKNKYTSNMAPCNTIKVGDNLDTKGYVIGLSSNSGLSMLKINTIILEMRESGIINDFEDKWLGSTGECGVVKNSKDQGRLSLETLIGVFYILLIGLILALAIQIFECWGKGVSQCCRTSKK